MHVDVFMTSLMTFLVKWKKKGACFHASLQPTQVVGLHSVMVTSLCHYSPFPPVMHVMQLHKTGTNLVSRQQWSTAAL